MTRYSTSFGTKVAGGLTVLITVIFGELYVFSMHWEAKARILRAHSVCFLEAVLLLLSKFVWNNFSSFESETAKSTESCGSLKKAKYSDVNLHEKDVEYSKIKLNVWKVFLIGYLGACHLSFLTNYFWMGREPYLIAYCCYAALGLLVQIVVGLVFVKAIVFIFVRLLKNPQTLFTKARQLQIVLTYAVLLWMIGLYNASSPPSLKEVTIPIKGLPLSLNGMKIVQISDIHLGPTVGRWRLDRIVSIINDQDPDIVVMTGDLVDGSVQSLKEAAEPAEYIKSKWGKFFVTGNHEYYTGDVDNWFTHLRGLGFVVLHNSNVRLPDNTRPSTEQICLGGTDDIDALKMGYEGHGFNLKDALATCDRTQPVVLLAHQPKAAKLALDSEYRVDLVLSGHTHGGQFFPMTLAGYLFNPFFYGLYQYGESSHVYVSMGTQYWGVPVRIGSTMEITRIVLKTA